jgi:hypothetical protein
MRVAPSSAATRRRIREAAAPVRVGPALAIIAHPDRQTGGFAADGDPAVPAPLRSAVSVRVSATTK